MIKVKATDLLLGLDYISSNCIGIPISRSNSELDINDNVYPVIYFIAGMLVIGDIFGNAPSVDFFIDEELRGRGIKYSYRRLSNPKDNEHIRLTEGKDDNLYDIAVNDLITILSGPIAEKIFRTSRGERMTDREDVIDFYTRNMIVACPVIDVKTGHAVTDYELIKNEIKGFLQQDKKIPEIIEIILLPRFYQWVGNYISIAKEFCPEPFNYIINLVYVERAQNLVIKYWSQIENKVGDIYKKFTNYSNNNSYN